MKRQDFLVQLGEMTNEAQLSGEKDLVWASGILAALGASITDGSVETLAGCIAAYITARKRVAGKVLTFPISSR